MSHAGELCCLCKRILKYVGGKHVNDYYPIDLSLNYEGMNISRFNSSPGRISGYLCSECMSIMYPLIRHIEIVAVSRENVNADEAIEKLKVAPASVELSPEGERLKPEETKAQERLKKIPGFGGTMSGQIGDEEIADYWRYHRKEVEDQMMGIPPIMRFPGGQP